MSPDTLTPARSATRPAPTARPPRPIWAHPWRLLRTLMAYLRRDIEVAEAPLRLWIEPTSRCNLRCVMCPTKDMTHAETGFMDMDLFQDIVDQAASFAVDANLFMSGESLIHPEFPRMVAYARSRGIGTRLNTNATLLTPALGAALIEAGLDRILFSFDGYTPEVYERIRVNASFERTLKNVVGFLEEKRRRRARRPHATLQVIDVPGVSDYPGGREAAEAAFLARFRGLPLDRYVGIPVHNYGGQAGAVQSRGGSARYTPCTFLWYSLTIRWDGTVVPCCLDTRGRMAVGDVRTQSLLEIWNGAGMRDLRDRIARGEVSGLPLCGGCDVLWKPTVLGVPIRTVQGLFR